MNRRGFTIVELLVVVGILAVLAAFLFPVFNSVRRSARGQQDASNLEQLGIAVVLYATDNDDALPNGTSNQPGTGWPGPSYMTQLHAYVTSAEVYHDPLDRGIGMSDEFYGDIVNANSSAYASLGTSYFYELSGSYPRITTTAQFERSDSRVPAFFDASGAWLAGAPLIPASATWDEWHENLIEDGYRYNTVFFDGHTKNLTEEEWRKEWSGSSSS